MKRFIQGANRAQLVLMPERLDDFVDEDNPVRVIDVYVESLNLGHLGFEGVTPCATGRPGYHPSALLKLYLYGYFNRIHSSRRLEREAQRNVELMWLLERLTPDFKTIADFRKDNGGAIRGVCRDFVRLCRKLDLFTQTIVAIDGSKLKAVNNRDKNFTPAKLKRRQEQVEASIDRYLAQLDSADRQAPDVAEAKTARLREKILALKAEQAQLKVIEAQVETASDKQISLTDPDARSMKTRGNGIVGYNVQTAVDTTHHLIVSHEVINSGSDRGQLSTMARQARLAMDADELVALADRGYYKSEEILACDNADIVVILPKPKTSNNPAKAFSRAKIFVFCRKTTNTFARRANVSYGVCVPSKRVGSSMPIGARRVRVAPSSADAHQALTAGSIVGLMRTYWMPSRIDWMVNPIACVCAGRRWSTLSAR